MRNNVVHFPICSKPRRPSAATDERAVSAAMRAYTRARFRVAVIEFADQLRRSDRQAASALLDEIAREEIPPASRGGAR